MSLKTGCQFHISLVGNRYANIRVNLIRTSFAKPDELFEKVEHDSLNCASDFSTSTRRGSLENEEEIKSIDPITVVSRSTGLGKLSIIPFLIILLCPVFS